MAYYIKANPKVAQYLSLTNVRNRLRGEENYILFQNDMAAFGSLTRLAEICRNVGALALTPWEARQEQDGKVRRKLPKALDERFVMEDSEQETEDSEQETGGSEQETEDSEQETGDSEQETEDSEQETGGSEQETGKEVEE